MLYPAQVWANSCATQGKEELSPLTWRDPQWISDIQTQISGGGTNQSSLDLFHAARNGARIWHNVQILIPSPSMGTLPAPTLCPSWNWFLFSHHPWKTLLYEIFFSILMEGKINGDFIFRSLQGLASSLHEGEVISKHRLQKFLPHLSQASRNVVVFLQDTVGVGNPTPLVPAECSLCIMSHNVPPTTYAFFFFPLPA